MAAVAASEAASEATTAETAGEDAAAAFWALQSISPYWTVPLAHGASMPWLKPFERGLLVSIDRCHGTSKTPLLIDATSERLVDTFYSYQAAIIVEAKKMVLDVAMKRATHEEVMESLRLQLVNCMKFGQTLYIRMADSACDFRNTFTSDDHFPLGVFDRATIDSLTDFRDCGGENLWGSAHPLAKVLREADLVQGIFQARFSHKAKSGDEDDDKREGFDVVVATQFKPDDFAEMLADALPLAQLQPIYPQPSTVRLKYSHYNQEFNLEVGGSLRFASLDERYSLSFVFKGQFGVRLVELPPVAAGGGSAAGAGRFNSQARGRDRFRTPPPQAPASGGEGEAARRVINMDVNGVFFGLKGGLTYEVTVEEDDEAEALARAEGGEAARPRLSAAALTAQQQQQMQMQMQARGAAPLAGRADDGRTRVGELLSAELRNLSVNEIAERSERYQRLREAQDLQEVVFGGGG